MKRKFTHSIPNEVKMDKEVFFNIILAIAAILVFISFTCAEEGMIPLSELNKLDLKSIGFEIEANDIFNSQAVTLSDAIINLSGCTGSFISPNGLILTNHHCAYGAAQRASDSLHDYIKTGFLAGISADEIEAKGYTVRVAESYHDVSAEVLEDIDDRQDHAARYKIIEKRIKEIVKRVEDENPGQRAEVAEMFAGKTYILFIYTYLKDVRLVYIPPRSIGEFGGDYDNWEWPRHNADFAIMRAYTASDGSPAAYSKDNIPYHPKKHLKVSTTGVEEGDLVFMLGYPGRTFRHQTSYYMAFEKEVRMPFVVEWYQWQMNFMEEMSRKFPEQSGNLRARIKGLANTEKNYRGKLQGLKRLKLTTQKHAEEAEIHKMILADRKLKKKYDTVLAEIAHIFENDRKTADRNYLLSYLTGSVNILSVANTLFKAAEERQKPDLERESAYMDRNFEQTKQRVLLSLKNLHVETDKGILKELLNRAANLSDEQRISALDKLFALKSEFSERDVLIDQAYELSRLNDRQFVEALFSMTPAEIKALNDPFINWIEALQPEYKALKEKNEARSGALNKLSAQWIEMKQLYLKTNFIPDANSTFRFTYGRIKGYAPADAVYKAPFTTLSGVIEKTTGVEPFDSPHKLIELYQQKNYAGFASKKLNDLPACILYDMDTTGGNSGSPVLNAAGELVGLNFDRTFEATINDFAWSATYSRSIGVDIRYILWVLSKFAGADNLLMEMGVPAK